MLISSVQETPRESCHYFTNWVERLITTLVLRLNTDLVVHYLPV